MRPMPLRVATTVVAALLGLITIEPAPAEAADRPSFTLTPSEAKVGDRVTLHFAGWTSAAVTVQVCGNLGLRGAPDCDQIGGQGIGLSPPGPALAELVVTRPPVPCPCIVRATSATSDEEQTAPIVISGHPVGPVRGPGVPASLVRVSARVTEVRHGLAGTIRPLLGGRRHHKVAIRLSNTSAVTLSKVSLGLVVGRAESGKPVAVPAVEPLRAGETRVYEVPATVSAPTWGHYLWEVTADGAGPEVEVKVTSTAAPWLLYLLLLLLAGDAGAFLVLRVRRRSRRRRLQPAIQ